MGSGQPIADPFLGMISRVFFGRHQPNLREGIFLVTWALDHAIDLNVGGINGPPQLGVLRRQESACMESVLLGDDELQEHLANVRGAEAHLAAYRDILAGTAIAEGEALPPSPPPPPDIAS